MISACIETMQSTRPTDRRCLCCCLYIYLSLFSGEETRDLFLCCLSNRYYLPRRQHATIRLLATRILYKKQMLQNTQRQHAYIMCVCDCMYGHVWYIDVRRVDRSSSSCVITSASSSEPSVGMHIIFVRIRTICINVTHVK